MAKTVPMDIVGFIAEDPLMQVESCLPDLGYIADTRDAMERYLKANKVKPEEVKIRPIRFGEILEDSSCTGGVHVMESAAYGRFRLLAKAHEGLAYTTKPHPATKGLVEVEIPAVGQAYEEIFDETMEEMGLSEKQVEKWLEALDGAKPEIQPSPDKAARKKKRGRKSGDQ